MLREEQINLMKSNGALLTKDLIDNNCPYLEAVVKEVMRLIPINGGPKRQTNATVSVDGYQIPKKWWVVPSIYLTHESDPITSKEVNHMDLMDGFKPERWFDKSSRPKEYMPFGMSHRLCAGNILAMAEMKVFLALFCRAVETFTLMNNLDLKDMKWKFTLIPTPKDDVSISIGK